MAHRQSLLGADGTDRVRWALGVLVVVAFFLLIALPHVARGLSHDRGYTSDFGRDAIGAALVESGQSPYRITTLRTGPNEHPLLDDEGWIAHSPASIAGTRALISIAPVSSVELVLEVIALLTPVILGGTLALVARTNLPLRLALLAVPLLGVYAIENIVWLQSMGVMAIAVVVALISSERNRSQLATALIGVLVAVKVWPAFLALAISRRWIRSTALTGLVAITLTIGVLPFAGGFSALGDWILRALPANTADHVGISFSLLSMLSVPSVVGLAMYAGAMISVARLHLETDIRVSVMATLHLALAPLVWPWMVLGLLPALVWPVVRGRTDPVIVAASFVIPVLGITPFLLGDVVTRTDLTRFGLVAGQVLGLALWAVATRGLNSSRKANQPTPL